ncbi:MAG TPA: hypothetical protein DCS66_15250 [Flavobacteriaceae bacterium]|nr:hypothetical protein [Flavobacteriaceae bacterium]|tara:strand:- start:320 stop:757 length:438 start_codon:yes stop_codon:yes gene_type:complete
MKNIKFLLIIAIITTSCNKQIDYKEAIIGVWETDSILNYENGVEKMIRLSDKNNIWIGSLENPKTFKYTKYNEFFLIDKANNNNQFSDYKIVRDSIYHEKSYFDSKILELTDKKLVFKNELVTIWMDNNSDHPKQIMTYYLTKKE